MADDTLDPNSANLPPQDRAAIEGLGLYHAPTSQDERVAGEAFHHPERDAVGTQWEPNWEPIDSYRDGEVVMLDDGSRQLLGLREMGMWMQLVDGDEVAQPDYQPMLWSDAPDQVKYDMTRGDQAPYNRAAPPTE